MSDDKKVSDSSEKDALVEGVQEPDVPAGEAESHPGAMSEPSKDVAIGTVADTEPAEEPAEQRSDAGEPADDARPKASPTDLAKRAFALAEEDEGERIARLEEAKLEERRKLKKQAGLEGSTQKRLEKIGTKPKKKKLAREAEAAAAAAAAAADDDDDDDDIGPAKPLSDPLLDRAARIGDWAKQNKRFVGYAIAAAAIAFVGSFVFLRIKQGREIDASTALAGAIADEGGVIGDPDKKDDEPLKDPRPIFKTEAARRESTLSKYRLVESKYKGTGAAILARLGEAGILLDNRDADGAIAAYTEVKNSQLATVDAEVRGRAFEGLGFAQEQKGQLDDALKTFKSMQSDVDFRGFKELAIYHQARILAAKGDKDKAKELFKSVKESIKKPGEIGQPFAYLGEATDQRLAILDPASIDANSGMGGGGVGKMTPLQMKRLREQMMKLQKNNPHAGESGGGPGGPPMAPPHRAPGSP